MWLKVQPVLAPYVKVVNKQLSNIFGVVDDEAKGTSSKPIVDEESNAKGKEHESQPEKVFSVEELKNYDGKPGSKGLYLAFLGQVFDVKKGEKFYGPGGGYEFFAGRDASRAFVTGNFDGEGLTDDIAGMSDQDYLGIKTWIDFYHSDYKYVGRYYTASGEATQYQKDAERWIADAKKNKDKADEQYKIFPPCNTEWNQDRGTRVWCTKKSGGIERTWEGVPRRLFSAGQAKPRCACVKDFGAPLSPIGSNSASKKGRGDLDNPNLQEYPGCLPNSNECQVPKED
ncbi:hypothetical protein HAZT_HAZT007766 [Hyalella azteca]|uniref:Cytochrome b5 heme-binding domain-containing protein n=1 Tax=Hyalella azteca TaxID=294128 RepID=A0A6A0H4V2_HYAAZ|nr:hypothetical protein HAZT_HAZT007766 [Hyalella azteca]